MREMNRPKRLKRLSTTILQGLIGLTLFLLPQQGHALSFTVDSVTANVGDTFSLNLNVADAVDLTSWEFDLTYDPTILQANLAGATAGAFLPGDWFFTSPGTVDNIGGQILGVSAFGSPVSGSGVLASIEFTLLSAGLSPVTASNVFLNLADPTSGGFTVTNGSAGAGSTVPEPSTVLLLLLSGIMLWGVRRWNGQAEISQ